MITQKQLDSIERFADKLWGKVGLDVEFTRHFLDRLNDSRNKKDITPAEIQRLFKQSYRRYGKKIASLGQGAQAVINDMETDINMPFVLQLDKNGELDLVAKTVMRKKDFKTTNQKFTVESGAGEEGTKQLSYKYRKDTPKQSINGKTESNMKRQKFIPKSIIDEDVPAFMGALAQAAKDGKKEFEFGGKTFKVKLKKDVVDKITKNMDESEDLDDLFIDCIISDLVEAAAADYAKLSDKELLDLFGIFKNVGRSAAQPVVAAIKRELQKRSMKEGFDLEEAFDRLPGHVIGNELFTAHKSLTAFLSSQQNGNDVDIKKLNQIIKDLQDIKKQVKKFNKPEEVPVSYQYKESTDLEESTELYNDSGVIINQYSAGAGKMGYQITVGRKYIQLDKKQLIKVLQGLGIENVQVQLRKGGVIEESTDLEEARKAFVATANRESETITFVNDAEAKQAEKLFTSMKLKVKRSGKRISFINTAEFKSAKSKVMAESVDLEEGTIILKTHSAMAAERLKKKLTNKFFSSRDQFIIKGSDLHIPDESHIVRLAKKQPEIKESTDLEEAKRPFKELEKAWIRTKGNEKAREKLIKKHDLKPIISNVRPGSIKLGPLNDLKMKKGDHTMAGLDADGELIFVTNNPVKIYYPSNTKPRPDGEEMREDVSIETQRLRRVVQIVIKESDTSLIDDFIAEGNIELNMAPSKIQSAYKKYVLERTMPQYEIYHKSYSDAMQSAIAFAKGSGYEVDEDDWHDQVSIGPRKPSKDKVNRFSILLIKNGKEQKKRLQIQVTNLGTSASGRPFELNAYIA